MIAMISPQSRDTEVSRNSNAAGAPLPLIPRRGNSASPAVQCKDSQSHSSKSYLSIVSEPQSKPTPAPQTLHPSSCFRAVLTMASNRVRLRQDSETIEAPQHKGSQPTLNKPIQNVSACSDLPSVTASGNSPGATNCECSKGYDQECALLAPTCATRDYPHNTKQSRSIHKKTGQRVKPSLKSPSSCLKADLSVVTFGNSSKSEPTTPTLAKAVHFDSQLEHVKLFLAQQKPLAVSRDGSPTDDTSGTDSDFPSFIFRSSNNKKTRRVFSLNVINIPLSMNKGSDVALETLSLTPEGSSISGQVRLRNIAYKKALTVRFTFDNWSTMNEVTGRYLESIDVLFDRFVFEIRLQHLLLEGKALILALRYTVDGREIWDNNMGRNYVATFSRLPIQGDDEKDELDLGDAFGINFKQNAPYSQNGDSFRCRDHNNLRNRCDGKGFPTEPVVHLQEGFESIFKPLYSTPNISFTPDNTTRLYDTSTIPWPQQRSLSDYNTPTMPVVSLGSPRDLDSDTFRPAIHVTFDIDDVPFDTVPYSHVRNHQRGYFDSAWQAPDVRPTPPVVSLFNDVFRIPFPHSLGERAQ